jgi:DNA-binding PadR family transcriptional regulator
MTHSGRERHRDRDPGFRQNDDEPVPVHRLFRITSDQREEVAKCLRYIDEARRALEGQQNAENREIIRELRASADRIYDLLNDLEEIDG